MKKFHVTRKNAHKFYKIKFGARTTLATYSNHVDVVLEKIFEGNVGGAK